MTCAGELDLASLPYLRKRFDAAAAEHDWLIVDLGDAAFVDLSVIRALSELASQADVRLVVVLPYATPPLLRRLFFELAPELVRFAVVPTVEAALRRFGRAGSRPVARCGPVSPALLSQLWSSAFESSKLLAQRDRLIVEQRRLIAARRTKSPRAGR